MEPEDYFLSGKLYIFGGFDERFDFKGITPRTHLWDLNGSKEYYPKIGETFMCVRVTRKTVNRSKGKPMTVTCIVFLSPDEKIVFDIFGRFSRRIVDRWHPHPKYFEEE